MTDFTHELDARGLNCPLPILKIRKTIKAAETGDVIRMVSTDPGSVNDMEAFCRQTGNDLVASERHGNDYIYFVRKA